MPYPERLVADTGQEVDRRVADDADGVRVRTSIFWLDASPDARITVSTGTTMNKVKLLSINGNVQMIRQSSQEAQDHMAELQSYTGNVWTHIISLKREDASRLGYDNAKAWLDLIRAHRNEITEAMQINPDNFRWYAAFHDEGDHPHIHMMAWSKNPKQGYLSREGLQSMKSLLTNDIFRMEMLQLYRSKSQSRDELVQTARDTMVELAENLRQKIADVPEIEQLLLELSYQLP